MRCSFLPSNTNVVDILRGKNVILVSHWDVDGLCSVVKIWRYLGEKPRFYTPPIGLYDIPNDEVGLLTSYDYILVMDMSLPSETLSHLSDSIEGGVIVIDHHYHPVRSRGVTYIDYPMESGVNYYSNTLLIDDYLGLENDILTILGVVGDYYTKVRELEIFDMVKNIAGRGGLGFEDIYRLTLLIDSNHLVNDREAVYRAAETLYEYQSSIGDLLNHGEWINRYESIESEIDRVVGSVDMAGEDILFHSFSSKYYIISKIGRRLTEVYPSKKVVLHNYGYSDVYDQIYVRVPRGDLLPLIEEGLRRGYICGGKVNVAGFLVPKNEARVFIEYVLGWISKL